MKNLSSSKTNKLLLKYVIKVISATLISVLCVSFLFSEALFKLDLNLETGNVFSIFTVLICSAIISYVSVLSLKNNGAVMGMISVLPLIFYCLVNMIIYDNSFIFFLIKLAVSLLTGALFGILATKKAAKFRV